MNRYMESPDGGTRHAYFGGAVPDRWRVVDGDIPGPSPPSKAIDVLAIAEQAKSFDDFKALLRAAKDAS